MDKWISVKDELPKIDETVLVKGYVEKWELNEGYYFEEEDTFKGFGWWNRDYTEITHWQPLPPPPEK